MSQWLERESVTAVRCVDVNWGREKLPCHRSEGILSTGKEKEEQERRVKKMQCQVCTRRKPLQTTDWGVRGTECGRFFVNSVWSSISEVLEVHDFCQSGTMVCTSGEKEDAWLESTKWCMELLGHNGRDCFHSWSTC